MNQKMTGRASTIPGGLAIGETVGMLITLLIVVVGAVLVSNEVIDFENIGYCSMIALVLGSVTGAVTAVKKIKRRKFLMGVLSGVVYYLMLLMVTALFFGGQYRGMGVTLLLVLGGSIAGAIMANREKGRGMKHRSGKIHR